MFQLQLFFLLHCDEWDRVVALPRHKFVTGATLLQLPSSTSESYIRTIFTGLHMGGKRANPQMTETFQAHLVYCSSRYQCQA